MDDLVAQGSRHSKGPAIDDGPWRRCGDRGYVADVAADRTKELRTGLRIGRRGQSRVPRRDPGSAHEVGELVDVRLVGTAGILRISHRVTHGSRFVWLQTAGDSHLIHVGVGCEGEQTRLLVLPAETPAADLPS